MPPTCSGASTRCRRCSARWRRWRSTAMATTAPTARSSTTCRPARGTGLDAEAGRSWQHVRMPRFAANLTLLYTEQAFLDRAAAAARDGFEAVECQFPYEHPAAEFAA
eukprot:Opistho-1_new@18139